MRESDKGCRERDLCLKTLVGLADDFRLLRCPKSPALGAEIPSEPFRTSCRNGSSSVYA
jgi:hypothetical protein